MTQNSAFLGLNTDDWQAIGSIATAGAFLIAALAVLVAFLQLRHARDATDAQRKQDRETAAEQLRQNRDAASQQLAHSRAAAAEQLKQDRRAMSEHLEQARLAALDQSRPYVVISVDLSPISLNLLDLVVENAGSGPAFDVSITVDPPLRRAMEEPGDEIANARLFREPLSMLPPRYRLRTYFDSAIDRGEVDKDDLPATHELAIAYHDGRGNHWSEHSTLDMTIADGLLFTEEYGLHHLAKAIREIRDLLKKSNMLASPLAVTVEDRVNYLDRVRAKREERWKQHEQRAQQMRADRTDDEQPPEDHQRE